MTADCVGLYVAKLSEMLKSFGLGPSRVPARNVAVAACSAERARIDSFVNRRERDLSVFDRSDPCDRTARYGRMPNSREIFAMNVFKKPGVLAMFVALATGLSSMAAEGRHKIVVLAFGDDEFAIVDLAKDSGKLVSFQERVLPKCEVGAVSEKDGLLTVELKHTGGVAAFEGKADAKGVIKGQLKFRNSTFPAELLKTEADKVAEMQSGKATQELIAALRANAGKQPKDIRASIETILEKYEGKPYANAIYSQYLNLAEQFEMKPEEIQKTVDAWLASAKVYGDAWVGTTRKAAMAALRGKKNSAETLLVLAQEADKTIDEQADMDGKVEALSMIVDAARLLDKKDLADATAEKLKSYESKLDENYKTKVPPFKPEKVAEKVGARPVVMELFTGAQCPPCVAADVAFDALGDTYSPSNVILLQYHLHIPGPDPLTNEDAIARQKYYGSLVQGTPSTFFNGMSEAGGGGNMAMSEGKYQQYREVIEKQLAQKPAATVDLSAKLKGDSVEIIASAKTAEKPGEKAMPRLRLVLTEEIVKYVGGNKLRFHHHVVRDLPGGADGVTLDKAGEGKNTVTVDLKSLRGEIETYVSDYEKNRKFAGTLPAVDLKSLSVVAFVQDDETKEILGAAQVEVKASP
jgi:hypothetical protein